MSKTLHARGFAQADFGPRYRSILGKPRSRLQPPSLSPAAVHVLYPRPETTLRRVHPRERQLILSRPRQTSSAFPPYPSSSPEGPRAHCPRHTVNFTTLRPAQSRHADEEGSSSEIRAPHPVSNLLVCLAPLAPVTHAALAQRACETDIHCMHYQGYGISANTHRH